MKTSGRAALLLCVLLLQSACGRKGALVYPDMLITAAPGSVAARQVGDQILLQFELPDKDRGGRPAQRPVSGARINRWVAAGPDGICRSCLSEYQLFRTLYLEHLPETVQRLGNRLTLFDKDVHAGNAYSYSIIPFSADAVDGTVATTSVVRVVAPVAAPDVTLQAEPTELRLSFSLPLPVSGTLLGYNVYRTRMSATSENRPVNIEPLKDGFYIDTSLERGVTYRYAVRAVLKIDGTVLESAESRRVEGRLKDDE